MVGGGGGGGGGGYDAVDEGFGRGRLSRDSAVNTISGDEAGSDGDDLVSYG